MKSIWVLRVSQTSTYYRRPLIRTRARTGYSGEFMTRVRKTRVSVFFFNSNNGPVIFYAEALFLQRIISYLTGKI